MKWFRRMFVWLSIGGIGATAAGQEVIWRPAAGVGLGKPAPIAAVAPIDAQGNADRFPRVKVVRGVQAAPDEPKFLPKDIAEEPKSFRSILTAPSDNKDAGPQDLPRALENDKDDMTPAVADALRLTLPDVAKGPATAPNSGGGLLLDENGNPLIDPAFGGTAGFYARAEYLLWWTRGMNLPPLVTTASGAVDPQSLSGALGVGTTQVLYGGNTTYAGPNSGARITLGYDLDPCGLCAIEASFFFLGQKNDNHAFDSSAYPQLFRPFFNVNEGHQDREFVTLPGFAAGGVRVNTSSNLLGAEANVRSLLWCECNYKITGLVGFRYLNLGEQLGITEQLLVLKNLPTVPPINAGDQITVFDRFSTRNQFYGGQIGIGAERQFERWTVEGNFKLALGATNQEIDITGGQQISTPNGGSRSFVGGLYALTTNIGRRSQNRFTYVPEIGVKVGYDINENIRVFVGYDFLYWSSVVRPGDQIDQGLNANLVPNSGGSPIVSNQARPTVPFATTSYWAQGVNAGVLFRY